jgi:hypothetical protein
VTVAAATEHDLLEAAVAAALVRRAHGGGSAAAELLEDRLLAGGGGEGLDLAPSEGVGDDAADAAALPLRAATRVGVALALGGVGCWSLRALQTRGRTGGGA